MLYDKGVIGMDNRNCIRLNFPKQVVAKSLKLPNEFQLERIEII